MIFSEGCDFFGIPVGIHQIGKHLFKQRVGVPIPDVEPTVILITGKGAETRQKRGTAYIDCVSDVEYTREFLHEYDVVHHLDGMEKVYPGNLSGGQQQRIALARAIVTNPKVMLLDEPLSNLDPKLRETMRFEIKELQKKFNFTIIFVTHDQSEAMALSDRMMVMDMGNIVQIGTPTELYNRPVNRFVHKFLGQSTFTDVVIQDGKVYAKGDMAHPLPVALPENGEREMVMATRPNQIEMNHTDGYKTKVEKRIFLTNYTEYLVRVGDQLLQVQTPHRNAFAQGETCYLKFPGIMWYGREDEQAEAERNRRQLV